MARKSMARRGPRAIPIELPKREVTVYASARVADALQEVAGEMNLWQGVKLGQVLEAVYEQGHKDGAREVFERVDRELGQAKNSIKHLNPGRPRKKRR
jgi:hypothetical protein